MHEEAVPCMVKAGAAKDEVRSKVEATQRVEAVADDVDQASDIGEVPKAERAVQAEAIAVPEGQGRFKHVCVEGASKRAPAVDSVPCVAADAGEDVVDIVVGEAGV